MKILITGVPGWLGNRLVECLVKGEDCGATPPSGASVRLLVLPGIDRSALSAWQGRAEIVEGDVSRPETLGPAVAGVDVVLHLAGIIHPKRIIDLYTVNTEGTRHLLAAARAAKVKRFVYVSSNSSAGCNASRDRLMTEMDERHPYLNYGRSKWLAENLVNEAGASGAIETVILRPCWYYGPWQPQRQTRFFEMIRKGNPILFGDGHNLRSMTYVDSLCQALILAATAPQAAGRTYWIADERPYETLEIYGTVARLLGVQGFKPKAVPGLVSEGCLLADRMLQMSGLYITEIHVAGEMNKNIACSIDRAAKELGYRPVVALEEGMRRSIAWCRARGWDV